MTDIKIKMQFAELVSFSTMLHSCIDRSRSIDAIRPIIIASLVVEKLWESFVGKIVKRRLKYLISLNEYQAHSLLYLYESGLLRPVEDNMYSKNVLLKIINQLHQETL